MQVNAPNGGDGTGIAQGLRAVADWTPPGGGKVSAVSLSWGSDEASWDKNSINCNRGRAAGEWHPGKHLSCTLQHIRWQIIMLMQGLLSHARICERAR